MAPLALLLTAAVAAPPVLLKPARVFDGTTPTPHPGWVVLVTGDRITAAGPADEVKAPADATTLELPGLTLLPGLMTATRTCSCTPTTRPRGTARCSTSRSASGWPGRRCMPG